MAKNRRLISKRFRIAAYMFFCVSLWLVCTLWLLFSFRAHADREMAMIRADFDERLRQVSSVHKESLDGDSSGLPVADSRMTADDVPRYIVLGHGRSRRWGYLDIQYVCDGEVDRFFYRPETLSSVLTDIDRELFRHENSLVRPYASKSSNSLDYE